MKSAPRRVSDTRELSDKELKQISSAMGDSVRLQTLNVSKIIQANLKAEFVARHKSTLAIKKVRRTFAT